MKIKNFNKLLILFVAAAQCCCRYCFCSMGDNKNGKVISKLKGNWRTVEENVISANHPARIEPTLFVLKIFSCTFSLNYKNNLACFLTLFIRH